VTSRRELREARQAAERARRRGFLGRVGSSSAKATRAARSAGVSLASRTGLRERRKQRERQELRGLRRTAGVLALIAVLLLAVWFAVSRFDGGENAPTVAARTQRVVLFQITGADGTAVGNVLLAHDEGSAGDGLVLIPPGLTVAGSGAEPVSLAQAVKEAEGKPARDALSKLLGVTIDGSFLLDETAFAALIDLSHGVTVDVPKKLAINGVTIAAGKHPLDGASAAAYATYLGRGESEDVRLGRLQAVLRSLIPKLPRSAGSAAVIPAALGPGMSSSLPDDQLGAVLSGLAGATGLRYERLPVEQTAEGGKPTYAVDRKAADRLMADLFRPSHASS
jgi:hypothetical protein